MKAAIFLLISLLGLTLGQQYEDCEVWLYRTKPSSDNIFNTELVSEVLTGAQESFDTIYHEMTPFRYFAFQGCTFETTTCKAISNRYDQQGVPYTMLQNEYLYTAPVCSNNFTLICNQRIEQFP